MLKKYVEKHVYRKRLRFRLRAFLSAYLFEKHGLKADKSLILPTIHHVRFRFRKLITILILKLNKKTYET
jgi:hypothetical protein